MKKLFLIIIVFHNLLFSQNSDGNVSAETISDKIQTHCFENLKPFKELDSLPNWKNHTCTILDNLVLLQINTKNKSFDEELHKSVISRLREISNLFYLDKTPIILTSGMDSFLETEEKNKNLEDDNKIIYVSIGECIMPRTWYEAKEIFNSETRKLINNK
ncbi:hypothetical protein [Flavobacterium marginilacus]|uniref:hypothetical protein n=1 Tax=Flavobacterium marginilacus TaxID=3003256 RepID=UPI00248E0F13|nr:hypothetical protein [Flavobacterium marginilacus]